MSESICNTDQMFNNVQCCSILYTVLNQHVFLLSLSNAKHIIQYMQSCCLVLATNWVKKWRLLARFLASDNCVKHDSRREKGPSFRLRP